MQRFWWSSHTITCVWRVGREALSSRPSRQGACQFVMGAAHLVGRVPRVAATSDQRENVASEEHLDDPDASIGKVCHDQGRGESSHPEPREVCPPPTIHNTAAAHRGDRSA